MPEEPSNVVSMFPEIEPIPGQPDDQIVIVLEGLLADAKEGNFAAFAFVALQSNGKTWRTWFHGPDANALVGACERMKPRISTVFEGEGE